MRFSLLLIIMVMLGDAQGQFIAPYNPDSNQDSAIGSADLIDFLAFFGDEFLPPAINIEGEDVLSTLISLTEQMSVLQTQVDLMQSEMMTKDSVVRLTWLRDLSQVDLEGASMVDTDLSRVDFSNANMQGAQLMNPSFNDALLESTNLSGANLLNADFDSAILSNADLSGANLQYAYFGFATLEGADLSGTDLSDSYLENTILTCLRGCPETLSEGYTCNPDSSCAEPGRFRIDEID